MIKHENVLSLLIVLTKTQKWQNISVSDITSNESFVFYPKSMFSVFYQVRKRFSRTATNASIQWKYFRLSRPTHFRQTLRFLVTKIKSRFLYVYAFVFDKDFAQKIVEQFFTFVLDVAIDALKCDGKGSKNRNEKDCGALEAPFSDCWGSFQCGQDAFLAKDQFWARILRSDTTEL